MTETSTLLHLSTAHISKETTAILDQGKLYVAKHEYGWFVWVDEDASSRTFPADLLACIQFAQGMGCRWIILDCDASKVDALPTYEW
jgi:hypothetical protein